jgi:hypothetical protein
MIATKRNIPGRLAFAVIVAAMFGELCVVAGAPYWSIPVAFGTYCAAAFVMLKV